MTESAGPLQGVRSVMEVCEGTAPTRWVHPEWRDRHPWLVQGTTGRGPGPTDGDFALFAPRGLQGRAERWVDLARSLGFQGVVCSRQVHGATVRTEEAPPRGLRLVADGDGHATAAPGVLMGVTVADCVPVFIVDPARRVAALLHAGWRGACAGILEEGVRELASRFGCGSEDLHLHLGPAICGRCYEVGLDVHEALGLPVPGAPAPVDLRSVLGARAIGRGIPPEQVTCSPLCTRCHRAEFFSHRGGDSARQVGFLGIRPVGAGLCEGCVWTRELRNRAGSRFLFCRRSLQDRSFPRYPTLPVAACAGFEATGSR
jgi:hypothetical protein